MIESKILQKNKGKSFPYIGREINADFYVLFNRENTGMVIKSNPGCFYQVGEYLNSWNDEVFEVFDGKIQVGNV